MSTDNGLNALRLPVPIRQELAAHAEACLPGEACGVLLGRIEPSTASITVTAFVPIKNAAEHPLHHFRLDPAEWTRLLMSEPDIVGLFHSHPSSPPEPSREDVTELQDYGSLFRVYTICSPGWAGHDGGSLLAYRIVEAKDESGKMPESESASIANAGPKLTLAPLPIDIRPE